MEDVIFAGPQPSVPALRWAAGRGSPVYIDTPTTPFCRSSYSEVSDHPAMVSADEPVNTKAPASFCRLNGCPEPFERLRDRREIAVIAGTGPKLTEILNPAEPEDRRASSDARCGLRTPASARKRPVPISRRCRRICLGFTESDPELRRRLKPLGAQLEGAPAGPNPSQADLRDACCGWPPDDVVTRQSRAPNDTTSLEPAVCRPPSTTSPPPSRLCRNAFRDLSRPRGGVDLPVCAERAGSAASRTGFGLSAFGRRVAPTVRIATKPWPQHLDNRAPQTGRPAPDASLDAEGRRRAAAEQQLLRRSWPRYSHPALRCPPRRGGAC